MKGDWVKLATRFYADPKIAALDDAAELMFVRGLARAGEEQAEGFIPEHALAELARRRRHATLVDALVNAGLWAPVPGGYQIVRWSDWNGELDALARRRAADRERQRKRRAADKSVSRDKPDMSRDSSQMSRDASRDSPAQEEDRDRERSLTPREVDPVTPKRNARARRNGRSPQPVEGPWSSVQPTERTPEPIDIASHLAERAARASLRETLEGGTA